MDAHITSSWMLMALNLLLFAPILVGLVIVSEHLSIVQVWGHSGCVQESQMGWQSPSIHRRENLKISWYPAKAKNWGFVSEPKAIIWGPKAAFACDYAVQLLLGDHKDLSETLRVAVL